MAGKLFYALTLITVAYPTLVAALWPAPNTATNGSSYLRLSPDFYISLTGSLEYGAPSDLVDAVTSTETYLKTDQLERLILGRGSTDEPYYSKAPYLSKLTVSLNGKVSGSIPSIAENAILPFASRDESYTLSVPSTGVAATLSANTTVGLFRGLTTFSQLWYTYDSTIYAYEVPIAISDKPAFPFRGFMLDTARNYFPVDDIKRTLSAMSWVKLNTFHWHIVDSQSFPFEVPGYPELAEQGAYDPTYVYTEANIQDIISYAGAIGIDVLVEIDTPGHTTAIGGAYPEYIACNGATPWADYANEPPAGQLRLANPTVLSFVASLFTNVAELFPSPYVSTGGDEVNTNCYATDAETQSELAASGLTFEEALSNFVGTTHAALRAKGKTPVVWEEMVLGNNVTLGNDTIVMVWISSDDVSAVAEKGFHIVHAASDYFYLDCGGGGWVGNSIDGNSWCDPFKTWQYTYSFDPLNGTTPEQESLILGGESLLWTEQSGPQNLDPIVWPRAASSAEVFWTGATLPSGEARNVDEALPRLRDIRYRFVQRGVNAIHLQPLWCALRFDACDLTA